MNTPVIQVFKKVLLIADDAALGNLDLAVKNRLQTMRGCTVVAKAVDEVAGGDVVGMDLVVVCSSRAPRDIRTLSVPLVVCHQAVLYDLGMTLATPDADFGFADATTSVNIKTGAYPFGLGLSGVQTVVQSGQGLGWARPGSDALVAAVLPNGADRAVLFGYDLGSKMPALTAPQRRVGFLFGGLQSNSLTENGWTLFDAAIAWAIFGGALIQQPVVGESAFWFIEGKPTKVLSIQEYREWVEEKVARKLLTYLSVLGLGGLIGLFVFINNRIIGEVKDQAMRTEQTLGDKAKGALETATDKLKTDIQNGLRGQIAETLVAKSDLQSQLEEKAGKAVDLAVTNHEGRIKELADAAITKAATPERVQNLVNVSINAALTPEIIQQKVRNALNDPEQKKTLVMAVVDQLRDSRLFNQILTDQTIPAIHDANHDQNASQREQALRFLLLFGNDQSQMRLELMNIITNVADKDYPRLGPIALGAYSPAKDSSQTRKDLETVLEQLGKATSPRDEMSDGYVRYLSRFPGSNAVLLAAWLKDSRNTEAQRIVIKAIAFMDGDAPIAQLAALTADPTPRLQELSWEGLALLDANRPMAEVGRRAAMEKLWSAIGSAIDNTPQPVVSPDACRKFISDVIQANRATNTTALQALLRGGSAGLSEQLRKWNQFYLDAIVASNKKDMEEMASTYRLPFFLDYVLHDDLQGEGEPDRNFSTFAKLVRTNDWNLLAGPPYWPSDATTSRANMARGEGLLLVWSERFKYEHLSDEEMVRLEGQLIDKIAQQPNCLYRAKLSGLLASAITHCNDDRRATLLASLVSLVCDIPSPPTNWKRRFW